MATYSKRGYKAPKERAVDDSAENGNVDEKDSTTAGVFSTLDESAFKNRALLLKIKILSLVL
jgi:hypothetical protein